MRMPGWTRWLCLLWATSLCSVALAADSTERFAVLISAARVGHLHVSHQHDDGVRTIEIDFDIKNNGRGPTIKERLQLDDQGLPISWSIQGATTFGSRVDEVFTRSRRGAQWHDASGEGRTRLTTPAMYIGQSASPWALGMYARALLAADGGRMATLPAGEMRLELQHTLTLTTEGQDIGLRALAISGLDLNPSYILLDDDNALFAYVGGRTVLVREGHQMHEERLRQLVVDLAARRLKALAQSYTHRFDGPLRIRNVRVFQPATLDLSEPLSVVVSGAQISSLQPLDTPGTEGETLVEGEGGTLVPGLFEMHAHSSDSSAVLNVLAGVTSMRDMGNNNELLAQMIGRIETGELIGPRITRSGFIEGKSPFSSNNGRLVDSEQAAIEAVRWYAARGYWQVKLYNSLNPAWSPAVIAEAQRLGLRVAGHVPAFSTADAMIDAGYDELTHINQIMLGWVLAPDEDTRTLLRITALRRLASLDLDSDAVQATLAAILEHKVAVEPTIAIHEAAMLGRNGDVPLGQRDYFDHMPVGHQRDAKQAWLDLAEKGDDQAYRASYQKLLELLRMMHQRGVLLIPGTDLGGGFTFHRELELFAAIGMSPAEALRRGTYDMAEYLGQHQQLGSIERGKRADFFLVAGDPTQDLKAIKHIRMVVQDGKMFLPAEVYPQFGIRPLAESPRIIAAQATSRSAQVE
ncbi:amidohydrolase family protein [Pseudomarimonas arenosa]|uniref:Amidohydrolase family protein n=1 Tax=Pseudomarimonas arenosa TaxID=2774145 RepID=A0AAW3ZNG2_9GAMM|nr:amidohydrolase family protein [Pseudomarimonas arenosa]MBD8525831.1 amidohydrolase family protein [Pseudomarimonas arenosa]